MIETKKAERIPWVDVLKLIGVILVYIGHLGDCTGKMYNFAWFIHVPLLFFCSGIVHKDNETFFCFFKKKINSIMVPYYFFAVFYMFEAILMGVATKQGLFSYAVNALFGTKTLIYGETLWFLPALFSVEIFSWLLNRLIRNTWFQIGMSLIISIIAVHTLGTFNYIPFCLNYALIYIFYYEFGIFVANNAKRIKQKIRYGIIVVSLCMTVYVYYAGGSYTTGYSVLLDDIMVIGTRLSMIVSFIGISILWSQSNIFVKLGRNTLFFFGNEMMVKLLFPVLLSFFGGTIVVTNEFQALIYTAMLILFVYYFVIPVEKPIMNKWRSILCMF